MRIALALLSALIAGGLGIPAESAQIERPFRLPFASPSGPDSWLMIQPYGNTVFAYRLRRSLYGAGQGIHFGIDLAAACGTEVVAVGEGRVTALDSPVFGAGPHSLMIDHPNGYASFYGHLLQRPDLEIGQLVTTGEVVGLSGDPDGSCTSRPHLHLEIRSSPGHNRAYNPILLIDADWEALALVGSGPVRFEQDLADPRRWQTLSDQPDPSFGGALLNDYPQAWPPDW
ncbi:MAG: M23 family metallopeptidase [Anaerolineales bacterium]